MDKKGIAHAVGIRRTLLHLVVRIRLIIAELSRKQARVHIAYPSMHQTISASALISSLYARVLALLS